MNFLPGDRVWERPPGAKLLKPVRAGTALPQGGPLASSRLKAAKRNDDKYRAMAGV